LRTNSGLYLSSFPKIRYQDPDGNPLLPESINFQDVKERDNEILADAIIREATADSERGRFAFGIHAFIDSQNVWTMRMNVPSGRAKASAANRASLSC